MPKRKEIRYEDVVATCSKAKFLVAKIVDNIDVDVSSRHTKRIALSLWKPSYILNRGRSGKLRHEVRRRLQYILCKLVDRHNWIEASGVLGMLLKGTCKDTSPMNNRLKYWVGMLIHIFNVFKLLFSLVWVHWMENGSKENFGRVIKL